MRPGIEGNLTPEQAQKVATSWKTQQTALLLDPDGKVGRAFGAKNTPNMVIINPDGKIAYEGAIDSKATPTRQISPARRTMSKQRWINHWRANLSPRHKPNHTAARSNINPRNFVAAVADRGRPASPTPASRFRSGGRTRPPLRLYHRS